MADLQTNSSSASSFAKLQVRLCGACPAVRHVLCTVCCVLCAACYVLCAVYRAWLAGQARVDPMLVMREAVAVRALLCICLGGCRAWLRSSAASHPPRCSLRAPKTAKSLGPEHESSAASHPPRCSLRAPKTAKSLGPEHESSAAPPSPALLLSHGIPLCFLYIFLGFFPYFLPLLSFTAFFHCFFPSFLSLILPLLSSSTFFPCFRPLLLPLLSSPAFFLCFLPLLLPLLSFALLSSSAFVLCFFPCFHPLCCARQRPPLCRHPCSPCLCASLPSAVLAPKPLLPFNHVLSQALGCSSTPSCPLAPDRFVRKAPPPFLTS